MPVDSVTYYTDSKVVLGYISNESKRFHVYVANRVHRIHHVSDRAQRRHIATDQNPADIASRSIRADRLMDTVWFTRDTVAVKVGPRSEAPPVPSGSGTANLNGRDRGSILKS